MIDKPGIIDIDDQNYEKLMANDTEERDQLQDRMNKEEIMIESILQHNTELCTLYS